MIFRLTFFFVLQIRKRRKRCRRWSYFIFSTIDAVSCFSEVLFIIFLKGHFIIFNSSYAHTHMYVSFARMNTVIAIMHFYRSPWAKIDTYLHMFPNANFFLKNVLIFRVEVRILGQRSKLLS